jgi:hypothetical protein
VLSLEGTRRVQVGQQQVQMMQQASFGGMFFFLSCFLVYKILMSIIIRFYLSFEGTRKVRVGSNE